MYPGAYISVLSLEFDILRRHNQNSCVEISKRGKVVAVLSPPPPRLPRRRKRKDFMARLKRIYGDKVFAGNIVVEERECSSQCVFDSRQAALAKLAGLEVKP